MQIAIVGATGNVGRSVIQMLLQKGIASDQQIKCLASPRSAGSTLSIDQHVFTVQEARHDNFSHCDAVLFNTESDISAEYVPAALAAGAFVVDSSSHYRLDPQVPLIIPPVNIDQVTRQHKLYAHANCLASPIATVMAPLHRAFGVVRASICTYQSVSGAGKAAMDACRQEMQSVLENHPAQTTRFPRPIAFNVIPQVGDFRDDGSSYEEFKIIAELKKVVDAQIAISATAVRVPVMVGHSIALQLELTNPYSIAEVQQLLSSARNVQLSAHHYSTPIEVVGSDDVFVGRLRQDPSHPHGILLWLCSDNLRRGAAADAIEILAAIKAVVD